MCVAGKPFPKGRADKNVSSPLALLKSTSRTDPFLTKLAIIKCGSSETLFQSLCFHLLFITHSFSQQVSKHIIRW